MPFYKTNKFTRQKPLGNYIADFYCPKLNLVIEIDGHSHGEPGQRKKDLQRTEFFEAQGLKEIRFTNSDVMSNIEGVLEHLDHWIAQNG